MSDRRAAAAILAALSWLCLASGRPAAQEAGARDGHIARAQIFDNHMAQPPALPGVGFLWGARQPLHSPNIIDSYYYPNQRDLDRAHTKDWFEANHPDWIVYQCDRVSPAYGYIYDWGAYAPLDTTNPAVRRYLLDAYIGPALQRGYKAIALDNVSIVNADRRCGVWRDGQWLALYSGESRDPRHTRDKLAYIGWLAGEIHNRGGLVALNAKVDPRQKDETRALIRLGDIWVDEGGFSDHCRHRIVDDLWRFKQELIAAQRYYVSINYSCGPFADSLTPQERDWIVASFLVTRAGESFLAVMGLRESGKWLERPFDDPHLGPALGAAETTGDLVTRRFQNGLAVVNISAQRPALFHPPEGLWRTSRGEPAGAEIDMPPRSGLLLLQQR